MKKLLRHIITSGLKKRGYELVKLNTRNSLPAWITEPTPIIDEVIRIPWKTSVLHMANKHYAPAKLVHWRTEFGDDYRIKYITHFIDVRGKNVLELGPYEGQHTIILEKMGAKKITSLEGRAENLEKCLRIKKKYRLENTEFILKNIEDLYEGHDKLKSRQQYDLVFCFGLLYHLPDPVKALSWMKKQGKQLLLGTQYVEESDLSYYQSSDFQPFTYTSGRKKYRGMKHQEGGLIDTASGMSAYSVWLYESELVKALTAAGYKKIHILGKDLQCNLPHITVLAE